MPYAMKTTTSLSQSEAEAAIRAALSQEGFGIITEIDMAATLKAKLDKDMPPYKILGACRPPLAAAAVEAEPDIGLLLPCNVVVYQATEGTVVAALDPHAMLSLAETQGIDEIADDAKGRLERALAALPD
jgi:uncharacterized protein (DUF302 family)